MGKRRSQHFKCAVLVLPAQWLPGLAIVLAECIAMVGELDALKSCAMRRLYKLWYVMVALDNLEAIRCLRLQGPISSLARAPKKMNCSVLVVLECYRFAHIDV